MQPEPVAAPRTLPPVANPPLMLEDAATMAVDALAERFPLTDPRALTFPHRKRVMFAWDDGDEVRTCWVSIEYLPADATISTVARHLFDQAVSAVTRRV